MYILILNPTSGRGLAIRKLPEIEAELRSRDIVYTVCKAETPEETTQLAREAVEADAEAVIAIGGDGTFFRVVNGIAESKVPMLFVPCGTGNDFVKSLKLPQDPIEALRVQLNAPISTIDVGRMNDIYFLNVAGTGFDVDVLRLVERHKQKHSGLLAYMLALREAIGNYHPTAAMISIDGNAEKESSFAIISIGNGRYIGGGMKAVPDAHVADGMFDVVEVVPVRKFMILPLIAFYIAGKHIDIKLASVKRCKQITVRSKGMTLNLDGELHDADEARFELLEGALAVRIPLENV